VLGSQELFHELHSSFHAGLPGERLKQSLGRSRY
jgi:hypothetical protein